MSRQCGCHEFTSGSIEKYYFCEWRYRITCKMLVQFEHIDTWYLGLKLASMVTPKSRLGIRSLCLDNMDDQVSWEDLVGQLLPSNRTLVWPGLSGGSHSPWELRYEGVMPQLPLAHNFYQLMIKFNAKRMTAPTTNE